MVDTGPLITKDELAKMESAAIARLEKIIAVYANSFSINRHQLADENLKVIGDIQNLNSQLARENLTMAIIKRKHDVLYSTLYNQYSNDPGGGRLTENGTKLLIQKTTSYIMMMDVLEQQKVIVDYLETVLQNFRNKNFAIKTQLEINKIESGF